MGTKDPRADAEKYLEQHNVRGLFKHLSAKVLYLRSPRTKGLPGARAQENSRVPAGAETGERK